MKQLHKKTEMKKKVFKICSECYGNFEKTCINTNCQNAKKKKWIDAMVFDFESQIKRITKRYWGKIQAYKSKNSSVYITNLMNTNGINSLFRSTPVSIYSRYLIQRVVF